MNPEDIIHKIGNSTEILEFGTTPARAFILVSQLQLALRHPGNTGDSAIFARQFVGNLTDAIAHHIPEARALIEQGWDAAYDITREYFRAEFCDEPEPDYEEDTPGQGEGYDPIEERQERHIDYPDVEIISMGEVCPSCGSTATEYRPTFGFWKCEDCSSVWGLGGGGR